MTQKVIILLKGICSERNVVTYYDSKKLAIN